MAATVAVVTDLIFATKIRGTAEALGSSVKLVRDAAGLSAALGEGGVRLVIVDLNAERVDAAAIVRSAKAGAGAPRVVAYFSHVQGELARAAREAGADEVLARSAFVERLAGLVGSCSEDAARMP